jgi:hypothetical protein
MKRIPNRKDLIAQQAAVTPQTDAELYESIHDAIVTSLEGGAINPGELLYDKFGVAVSLAMEQRLRHSFYSEGYKLHFQVTRSGFVRTLIFMD